VDRVHTVETACAHFPLETGDVVGARRQKDDDDYRRHRRPLSSVCVACVRSWALAVVRGCWLLFKGAGCRSRALAVVRGCWLSFMGAGCRSWALAVVRGRWLVVHPFSW